MPASAPRLLWPRVDGWPATGSERFVAVQGVDRAMAIGAQAYTALIPLLIVYVSFCRARTTRTSPTCMIKEFGCSGSTAASFKRGVRARR